LLQVLAEMKLPGLHLLCSSRDYSDIGHAFLQWPRAPMKRDPVINDIRSHVLHELSTCSSLAALSSEQKGCQGVVAAIAQMR
jgi:hypothetical protein